MPLAPTTDVLGWARISRGLPQPDTDTDPIPNRVSRYGENFVSPVVPTKHNLADEGSYFVASNPTPGTGVAHALVTAFSATSALFAIKNGWTPTDPKAKRLYLDRLTLMLTAAPTAGVSLEFLIVLDPADRTPSANTTTIRGVNVNGDDSTASPADIEAFNAGALTVPAAGKLARQAARIKMPVGLNIIGDVYEVQFGGVDQGMAAPPLTAIKAAQPAKVVAHAAPVIVGPGQWCVIHRWALTEATTPPSYEWELGYFER